MQTDMLGMTAVVHGGTKGIGRASVRKLAESGANVVIQGTDEKAARSLIDECGGYGGERLFVTSDLLTYEGVEIPVALAKERFGRVDVIISSGGPRLPGPKLFVDMTPEESLEGMRVRLVPRLYALHAAVKYMRDQNYGKVVLVTTDAARIPTPSESMIGAAGAATMFLTQSLAMELARHGIRVNSVATTLTTDTPRYDTYLDAIGRGSNEVIVKAFTKAEQKVAFRLNTAADLAEYILFLSSRESDQISGSTMSINGGLSFPRY